MKMLDEHTLIVNLDDEIKYKQITAEKNIMLPGQLVFAKLDDNALNPYRGKYQGQRGATGSKVFLDKDK